MMKGLAIDFETADRITVANLKNYRDSMKADLRKWKKNPKSESNPTGFWMHPEDVVNNRRKIFLIDELLGDFEV
jgi:hypothetical protein